MRTEGLMDRAVLDAFPGPVVVTNPHQRILLANEEALAAFGYRPAELLGRPLEFLLPSGAEGGETLARRKDGSKFLAEVRVRAAPSSSGGLQIVSIRDATERSGSKRATRRLATGVGEESRSALGVLSSQINVMLIRADGTSLPAGFREDLTALQQAAGRLAATFERLLGPAVAPPRPRGPEGAAPRPRSAVGGLEA